MTAPDPGARRPAAFLDRDGVINMDGGLHLPPGRLARHADRRRQHPPVERGRSPRDRGHHQSGVARGFYGLEDVATFHAHMAAALAAEGARIDAFHCCPFLPDGSVPAFVREHGDRKPAPGMLLRAMTEWPVDATRSVLFGDKASDMEAAARAGVAGVCVPANEACDLLAEWSGGARPPVRRGVTRAPTARRRRR